MVSGKYDIIYLLMFFRREIYSHFRAGFRSEASFLMACVLVAVLELGGIVGLGWYFLFRHDAPINPAVLIWASVIYLLCASMVAMLSVRFSKLMSVTAAAFFYICVGLFFLVFSLMDLSGRMIPVWPWVSMWVVTIIVMLANLGREIEKGRPHEPPS
jgi:hypothetical protein